VTGIICGVDVSSATLAARIGRRALPPVSQQPHRHRRPVRSFCRAHQVELVAMEATGGYEKQPFRCSRNRAFPSAILNPRAVRQFASGMGLLEKTDAIDAGMIAWFAEVKKSQPLCLYPAGQQHCVPWSRACASSPRSAPRNSTSSGWSAIRRGQASFANCWPWSSPVRSTNWRPPSPL
jgi:hypothetical protein